jgi:hypothetical protein
MQQLKLNLFEAYYNARQNKRNTYNQLRFEMNYEQELFKIYDEIKNKTYKVGKCIAYSFLKLLKSFTLNMINCFTFVKVFNRNVINCRFEN